jgi:hypothetical protein
MSLRLAWKMLLALVCCVALDGCAPWKTWSPKSLFGKSEATVPNDAGALEEVIAEPAKPRVKPKAKPEAKPEPKVERPSLMSKLTPSFWKKPTSVATPTKESLATDLGEKEPKLAVRPPASGAKDTPKLAAKPEDANKPATEPKVATPAKPQPPQIAVQQPPKTESSKPAEAPVPTSKKETGRWMPVQRVAERVKPPADHGFREQAVEPAPVVAERRADHPANAPASVATDDGDRSESADPSVASAPSKTTQGHSSAFVPSMPKVEHSEPPAEAAPVEEQEEIAAAPPVEETPFRAATASLATRKSSFQPRTPLPAEPINTASAEQPPPQHAENAPPRGSFFMHPSTPAATPAPTPEATVAASPPPVETQVEPATPAPSHEPPSASKWRGNSSFAMTRPPAEPPAESIEAKASEPPATAPATVAAAPPSASAWRAKAAPSVEKPAAEPIATAKREASESAPAVAAQAKTERAFVARQSLPESSKSSFRPTAAEEEPDLETRPNRQSPSPSTRIVTTPRPAPESQPTRETPSERVASAPTPVAFARENPQVIRPQVVFQSPPAVAEEAEPAPTAKPAAPEVVASEPPSDDDSAFTLGRSITMGAPVKAQDLAVTRPASATHKPAPRPVSVMPVEDPVASPKFAKAEPIAPRPAAKPPAERQVKAAPTGFARPAVIVVEAEAAPDPDQLPPLRMEEPGDWDRTERSHAEARPTKPPGTGIGTFVNSAPPADELPPILTPEEHARRNAQRRNGR